MGTLPLPLPLTRYPSLEFLAVLDVGLRHVHHLVRGKGGRDRG